MTCKPIIGVPADRRFIEPHFFHAVGEKYLAAITHSGGQPMILPVMPGAVDVEGLLTAVDGFFFPGSPSNIEPHWYSGAESRGGTWHDPERDQIAIPLIRAAIEAGVPSFGVCRGFQEFNVALGGSLHQHVAETSGYDDHQEDKLASLENQYAPAHNVSLERTGYLHQLLQKTELIVNSLHAQGIDRLADGLAIEARAHDGLIEAFRVKQSKSFSLAVQWHPEWQIQDNPDSMKIFQAFIDAAIKHKTQVACDTNRKMA